MAPHRSIPMGNGRTSDKVMLPEAMMARPAELRRWIARAFMAAAELPPKVKPPRKKAAAKTNPKRPRKRPGTPGTRGTRGTRGTK